MSASSKPVLWPWRASATARLTATVDLPTPPLPDATATIAFTSRQQQRRPAAAGHDRARRRRRGAAAAARLCAVSIAVALVTPGWRDSTVSAARRTGSIACGVRAVGQQRHLHEAAAQLDPLDQAGGHDVPAGGRIVDRAQRVAQRHPASGRHGLSSACKPSAAGR